MKKEESELIKNIYSVILLGNEYLIKNHEGKGNTEKIKAKVIDLIVEGENNNYFLFVILYYGSSILAKINLESFCIEQGISYPNPN